MGTFFFESVSMFFGSVPRLGPPAKKPNLLAMIGGFDNNMMWLYLASDGTQPRIKLRNLSKDLFTQVVYNLSLHGDFKVQMTLGR